MPCKRTVGRQSASNIKLDNSFFGNVTDFQKITSNKSKLIDEDINRRINPENSLCPLVYNLQLSSLPPTSVNFKKRGST